MEQVFKGRSFLAEKDFTKAELEYLIAFSIYLKQLKKQNISHRYLEGKNIALLFEKTSTRTRAAFTTAAIDLGAHPEFLGANDIQLGITLVYVGEGRNNMANSLLVTGAILGVNVRICAPKELFPAQEVTDYANEFAKESGSQLMVTDDIQKGVKDADVLYTDVWVSMGEEDQFEERVKLLKDYQINREMVMATGKQDDGLIVLHCLPAFHDTNTTYGKMIEEKFGISEMEITDDIFRSHWGRQFEEAENRMHSIKAIMAVTLGDLFIPRV